MVVPKKPDSDDGHSHLSREPFGRVGVSLPTQTGRDPYGVTEPDYPLIVTFEKYCGLCLRLTGG